MSEAAFSGARRFLPRMGSPAYHLLLSAVAILILGPLGGISAAFMNFSIGFFVGGQVLAGILGSAVTLSYGPEGKHGANYMQTMAASVAGMCGMSGLVQAMVWLGLPQPPVWQLILYFYVHRHVRRRRGHALYANPGGPPAIDLPLRPGRGQHPAGADRQAVAEAFDRPAWAAASPAGFALALAAVKMPGSRPPWNFSTSTFGGGPDCWRAHCDSGAGGRPHRPVA